MDSLPTHMRVSDAVRSALLAKRPVVALESAVLTHGLPREGPTCVPASCVGHPDFSTNTPLNISASLAMERAVRDAGAEPATVAIVDGALTVGCSAAELARLATDRTAEKASARDLGSACVRGACAGTTVSATLIACRIVGIRHFATGGIGGVHRGFATTLDISADLPTLARSAVCVVASGAKNILDVRATLEALEALGVPVVGMGTSHFPEFTDGVGTIPVPSRVDTERAAADLCRAHWSLVPECGVLVANPCPAQHAVAHAADQAMLNALAAEAMSVGIEGNLVTPWMLARVAERTGGRSCDANIALLLGNAMLAAKIACA